MHFLNVSPVNRISENIYVLVYISDTSLFDNATHILIHNENEYDTKNFNSVITNEIKCIVELHQKVQCGIIYINCLQSKCMKKKVLSVSKSNFLSFGLLHLMKVERGAWRFSISFSPKSVGFKLDYFCTDNC